MPRKKTKTTFVFDTSVLLYSPNSIFKFGAHNVVIPLSVLDELDKFKTRGDEVGRNSRTFSRLLYEKTKEGSISRGVEINDGAGILRVDPYTSEILPKEVSKDVTDNRILGLCLFLIEKGNKVVLITKDINLVIKAMSLGIEARDYIDEENINTLEDSYSGFTTLDVDDQQVDLVYSEGVIQTEINFPPNQFVMLRGKVTPKKTAFTRCESDGFLKLVKDKKELWGIRPRNTQQSFSVDLLMDDRVKLVTLTGKAGSGKSLLALAAGLQKVVEERRYDSLVITRPTISVGDGLGYLPGGLDEKLEPWMRPIRDAMAILFKTKNPDDQLEDFVMRDIIRIEPLAYIRGRSFHNSFIILDESQNLSRHEIKTFLTRAGDNTKMVLTGDVQQIDSPLLDSMSNGLTQVVERFKEESISGHMLLIRGERSTLASIASDIL